MPKFSYIFFILFSVNVCSQTSLQQKALQYIEQSNKNFYVAFLGEYYVNDSALLFFWPCIIDSQLTDETVKALIFEKDNHEWEITGLIDPAQAYPSDIIQWDNQFLIPSTKNTLNIPLLSLEDSLSKIFRAMEHSLQQANFNSFTQLVSKTSHYFDASIVYYQSIFTDLIFKGVDEIMFEILKKNDDTPQGILTFRTSNHIFRYNTTLSKNNQGYFIKKMILIE